MNKTLTVFTPTYNRKELLIRCYNSLKRQSIKDFEWLIIDDGSSDNTCDLVNEWINAEHDFLIRYYYKENGGLHTAYNLAIEHLQTELAVCIDSDDYMPDDAVERILDFWNKNRDEKYAGITGLDFDSQTNRVIGGKYPDNQKSINLIDLLVGRYPDSLGDKKHVVRSDLYKQAAPMTSFPGEKNYNPHYLHLEISRNYDFLILNENICYVDYQETGMTNNILRQYYNSPNSFAETRLQYLSFPNLPLAFKIRNCIHYVSSCRLANRSHYIRQSPYPLLTSVCFLPGVLLSRYITLKNKT